MVRRWSRINTLNNVLKGLIFFHFSYLFLTFKNSIIFKKFQIKHTKFKRKKFFKTKHRNNWLMYSQIIKSWPLDFNFTKLRAKYQFKIQLTSLIFLTYNSEYLNVNRYKAFSVKNTHLSTFVTKSFKARSFFPNLGYTNLALNYHFFSNYALLDAAFKSDNGRFILFLADFEHFYFFNQQKHLSLKTTRFNFDLLFFYNEKILFTTLLEIYKNLIYLWIYLLNVN